MCNKLTIVSANENSEELKNLLPIQLKKLESKHIAYVNCQTEQLHQNALQIGYMYDVFGSHRQYTNLSDEIARIRNMSSTPCLRAVRVVLTSDGKIWADNTHWTIAYILRFGLETQLNDIPFYVIDFRYDNPIVIDYNHTLFDSITEIKNAVNAAKNIQDRVTAGWRNNKLSYTIEELANVLLDKRQGEKNGQI